MPKIAVSKKNIFSKLKSKKAAISVIVILFGGLILAIIGLFALPILAIAAIDQGLQDSLGFTDTSAVLEKASEYVTKEQLSKGKIRSDYAADLEQNGILVGQVTASGDFVRTDTYIADLGSPEIASNNLAYIKQEGGELAILFDNEIITADNFIAKLESTPKMYAAYSKALNITARFYYSDEVEKIYQNFGLSRNNFSSWQYTGDKKTDRESFNDIAKQILSANFDLDLNGYEEENPEPENLQTSVKGNDATKLVNEISTKTKSDDSTTATKKATSLLNASVSSSEPYTAIKSFLLIEEVIQRARIDGDGPVDVVMDVLSSSNTAKIYDVSAGVETTTKDSILKTDNFISAVSNSSFSQDEALDYSRDRVINTSIKVDSNIINNTKESASGDKKFNILTTIKGDKSANSATMAKNTTSIDNVFYSDPIDTFESSIGGNRIVEGGAYLSNLINQNVLGAMPSDNAQISTYNAEVEEVLARRAEAERATLSPFDISSKNTFFGKLVNQFAISYLKNYSSSGTPVLAAIGETVASSVGSLFSQANAEGSQKYRDLNGDCPTANSVYNVEGDLYCNTHNTISTDYINYTLDDYKNSPIGSMIKDDGEIKDDSELAEFIALGTEREVTVGIESAEICESWKSFHNNGIGGVWRKIVSFVSDIFGLYESCKGVDSKVATGAKYTISSSNPENEQMKLFSSYVTYQMVSSLISDAKNQVTAYKERYHAEHPLVSDDSLARNNIPEN